MNTTFDSELYHARRQRWQKKIIIKRTSALKMNSHFFFRQFRFCFISLNMLNVGEFSRSWLSGTLFQFRKRKKNSSSCVYVLHKTPHKDVVVQWRQRNASKSALNVQSCCFAYLRPSPHKSGYFYYFFLHETAFHLHETSESGRRNRIVLKPLSRAV